jgi:hypothetical protein
MIIHVIIPCGGARTITFAQRGHLLFVKFYIRMQSDEVVWQVLVLKTMPCLHIFKNSRVFMQIINQGHCSYKVKTSAETFCRNKYSVTGLCNRSSCPLSNSRYATILEDNGEFTCGVAQNLMKQVSFVTGELYLCMKTVERAHKPATLWHRVALHHSYAKALTQIDQILAHWYSLLRHFFDVS